MQSSTAAFNLIVSEEVSSESYYTKHYQHFEFPGGASGPTVGIGYDCGYSTPKEIQDSWDGIISEEAVKALIRASGIRGERARQFVKEHGKSVTITWTQAFAEFRGNEMPKWEARVKSSLPNTNLLPGDCFGALVSLSYNRGTGGFHDPGSRFVEMRNITSFMGSKRFDQIPDQFMNMRRLWPNVSGLRHRREREADLFRKGLATMDKMEK